MCTVSNKLKLCTCYISEIDSLQHYWVLHRFVAEKREIVWGMLMLPYGEDFLNFEQKVMLLRLLNEGNAFDFEVDLKDGDLLHIAIRVNEGKQVDFGFEFKESNWQEREYDAWEWMEQYEEVMRGKVNGVTS